MLSLRQTGGDRIITVLGSVQTKEQLVRIVRDVISRITRFTASINPVDTGAMRDSWTWVTIGLVGHMYISLSAYNPRSYLPVIQYAPYVDERVGLMDAVMVKGERIAAESMEAITWKLR